MLIEIIFLQELSKDLSSNPHQLPAKVILIQKIGFSTKKKKFIMNKSSSPLLQLYLHLLHFLIMNKSSYFKKRKKKRRRKFSKRVLGLGALGSYFLGFFQKKKKNSKFSIPWKKFKTSTFFKKKKKIKIFNSFKIFKFFKFKKKKYSLNSSSGTESYDLLPYSPMVQHQVNCAPTAFIEAWSMSQTRGICQVCQSLFNK